MTWIWTCCIDQSHPRLALRRESVHAAKKSSPSNALGVSPM